MRGDHEMRSGESGRNPKQVYAAKDNLDLKNAYENIQTQNNSQPVLQKELQHHILPHLQVSMDLICLLRNACL